ncbi:unnamed protein product [Euphydryas editha]|uniref:Uncharacterized protein n=1 Tax=Euphydryas editha TaxID=104508 RepID=A0AAU9TQJ9_EUPED|nr:unnamed protein product [Euphydryas editha]
MKDDGNISQSSYLMIRYPSYELNLTEIAYKRPTPEQRSPLYSRELELNPPRWSTDGLEDMANNKVGVGYHETIDHARMPLLTVSYRPVKARLRSWLREECAQMMVSHHLSTLFEVLFII